MKLIAAVSRDWGIGLGDRLLFRIPEDLHRFKELTMGGTLVMGRKTMDTMPGGRPLPGRTTVVLTRDPGYRKDGVLVLHDPKELAEYTLPQPVFAAGGGEIYALLLPLCDEAYLTHVDAAPEADVFFPRLDEQAGWHMAEKSAPRTHDGLTYRFCRWVKNTDFLPEEEEIGAEL